MMINCVNGIIKALNDIKALGFRSCAIIRTPDFAGGYKDELIFSVDDDEEWDGLEPFHYLEWSGSIADLYREWPVMEFHREPFHEGARDGEVDLLGEILNTLEELRVNI